MGSILKASGPKGKSPAAQNLYPDQVIVNEDLDECATPQDLLGVPVSLKEYHKTPEDWCLKGNRPIDSIATKWPPHIKERLEIMRKAIDKKYENQLNLNMGKKIRNLMNSDSIESNK